MARQGGKVKLKWFRSTRVPAYPNRITLKAFCGQSLRLILLTALVLGYCPPSAELSVKDNVCSKRWILVSQPTLS